MQGCPFQCIYCDQRQFSAVREQSPSELLPALTAFCHKHKDTPRQIAFYGGTFTALPLEMRSYYYTLVEPFLDELTSLRISTRPDCLDDEVLTWCSSHRIRTIELGIQDFDDAVLRAAQRGYTSATALEACQRVKAAGLELGIQLMPGLPGYVYRPDHSTHLRSSWQALDIHPDFVRVYPCIVISGTPLWQMYQAGIYTPLSLEQAVSIGADYVQLSEEYNFTIIKLGIPPLEKTIQWAGPYHPRMGELVRTEVIFRKLATIYRDGFTCHIARQDTGLFNGGNQLNRIKLLNRLDLCSIKVKYDITLSRGAVSCSAEEPDALWLQV